ncbi:(deoxy)nucleoside triphosphate pyrophosphohydrolase [Streptomyces zingiberis]|uniref:(deoxy)nucleoside triphosphate pyrophosphohydrolase n=1 Tax=Streptomyces zingiberis TaxID=2053010 RepID=UPI001F10DBB4|nr:(deoxy)nucleoside triphosphate pyrophosphohydrolase [Streptomyces zingiberis]
MDDRPPGPAGSRLVVGGALLDGGRLLAARRSAPPALAGRWEFPGGKVEPGETPPQALVRELREELGVEAVPVARIPGTWRLSPRHVLQVWTARLVSGDPRPLEDHDALRWLTPGQVDEVDWLDEDRPALAEVVRLLTADGGRSGAGDRNAGGAGPGGPPVTGEPPAGTLP